MLEVKNLYASYLDKNKERKIVLKDISLDLKEGESLGIVGESGSGKSTLAKCIMGLKSIDSGEITFQGEKVHNINSSRFNKNRKDIQMVFQNPSSSLNPKLRVKKLIGELLIHYNIVDKKNLEEKTIEILEKVNLDSSFLGRFPRELSGGQRQRIAIARGISTEPKFLVLDEPTSALDLLIQKDILKLMIQLRKELNLTYLFISHDLEVIKCLCDRVIIMYNGEIIEAGDVENIFSNPREDYTKKLINSIPKFHPLED